RARLLALTPAGMAEAQRLKAASRAGLAEMLQPLPPPARAALAEGLATATEALDPPPVTLTPLQPGDAGWVIARHGAVYARDEGYDASFEALVAEILAGFLRRHDPTREAGWIARQGSRRLGSIFVMAEDAETARLRLVFLEAEARGTGLAQRLLDTALGFARAAGYRRMVLWTHESHRAAGRLYAKNGFALTASTPARAFGCDVVDQTWERAL
ncbi:GNAT family N-acetyltransferase, partial [Xinfangfangia pollutisoli]|uniref:GNAT family N-acetyltransferase n=1 Tax=Xinfangfangia pollutisoli TaxID=2865960 RepID=UPI00296F4878